ncbi:MAG: LuxR C-terminal-related transcriptional regulator [Burkholderiaceae bacterium]
MVVTTMPATTSLYRRREREPFSDAEIATVASMQRTLLAALARHAELRELREERSPATEALAVNLRRFFATHPARLSEREAETCVQIALGHANGAIADALGVSTHTVNTFRRRAYRKPCVGSVGALFGLMSPRRRLSPRLRCPGFQRPAPTKADTVAKSCDRQ